MHGIKTLIQDGLAECEEKDDVVALDKLMA